MYRFHLFLIVLLSTCGLLAHSHAQGVSDYLPYQGFLADANGEAVSGVVNLTIRVYRTETDNLADAIATVNQQANVQNGSFGIYLNNVKNYFTSGEGQWVGISVGDQPELLPRQRFGSIPYAFLSYNAQRFDGRPVADFVTQDQIVNIQAGLSADDVNALIDARGYLNEAAINALIDARGYLNEAAINALIDARGYLNADGVNALIDARNYLNADGVNALIDARNYLSAADIDARIANATANLQNQIDNFQGGSAAEILGLSNTTSTGRFSYGNVNGLRAAHEMCQDSYANVSTAHLCSTEEVIRATSSGNFNAAISGVQTWTNSFTDFNRNGGSNFNNCHSFLYNSADIADGTVVVVTENVQSGGGGGGVAGDIVNIIPNQACNRNLAVLCCR